MLKPTRVRHYLGLMKARGFAAETVLSGSGIDARQCSDVGYTIRPEQCHTVVSNMMRLSKDPALGLAIGTETRLPDLGVIGYAMASSKSLRQMIEIWTQYGLSPLGFPYSFPVQIAEEHGREGWSASARSTSLSDSIARFYIEETLAMGAKNFGPALTGSSFELDRVELPYRLKTDIAVYERFFGCPVFERAAQACIVVRSPALDLAVRGADDDLRELCLQRCGLLVGQTHRYGHVGVRLWSMLENCGGTPSLDQAAARLSMSPRSLRRHLNAESTTYQRLLDQFRCGLAKAYLGAAMMPPKEVGFLLGFSRTDAFARAFKNWTGETVSAYRRSMHN